MCVLPLNSLLSGGGTDDQCVKLVQALRALDVDAHLAGPDGREFSRITRDPNLPFQVTPPEGPAKLRFIRQERIQIVHGHHGRDLWPMILAVRLSGVRPKIVLTRRLPKSPSSWPSRRFLLGQVDAWLTSSKFVAHVLTEAHDDPDSSVEERRFRPPLLGDHSKIYVIYGGLDTDRSKSMDASAMHAG